MPRIDETARRRQARVREIKAAALWCCQDCGARHGKLIALNDNTYHRVELRIVHLDDDRENFRRENLRAVCGGCAPRYAATFNAAPRQGGLDRSLPPEAR
jgi:hypothetical protein